MRRARTALFAALAAMTLGGLAQARPARDRDAASDIQGATDHRFSLAHDERALDDNNDPTRAGALERGGAPLSGPKNKSVATSKSTEKKKMAQNEMRGLDTDFANQAAIGGLTEVQISKLAMDRGTDAVKPIAKRMIDDHGDANDRLKKIAGDKKLTLPAQLDAQHQAVYDRLSKLSGAEFDKAYIEELRKDHDKTVDLFVKETKTGRDPEMVGFAVATLPTLIKHVALVHGTIPGGYIEPKSNEKPRY